MNGSKIAMAKEIKTEISLFVVGLYLPS